MSQKFYKGRTNNHLSWVMVSSTDFATPVSNVSGTTKIKIYGKLRGAVGQNFVSSGTGSLTNDINHVAASATGTYTIALAKADLSDASAAWYDHYQVVLSATGCAYQFMAVDGGIDDSVMLSRTLVIASTASDAASAAQQGNSRVLVVQSQASDAYSAIIAPLASMTSDVASAVWAHAVGTRVDSRVLVVQSQASDTYSAVIAPLASMTSDIASAVWAHAIGARVDSRVLVNKSTISDVYSLLSDTQSDFQSRVPKRVATDSQLSDMASDIKSAVAAGPAATVTASDISDIASAVWANTIGARVDSRILVHQSTISDIYSLLSDTQSDFQSRVPKRVATDSQLSDMASDIKSAVAAGPAATVSASDISDIASAVWANTIGARVDSRLLVNKSTISDIYSLLSDTQSDFQSRVPKRVATDSQLSDLASDLKSYLTVMSGVQSDLYSLASDFQSDFQSRVPKRVATDSQLSDLASDVKSAALLTQSMASDVYSLLSDFVSDFGSALAEPTTAPAAAATIKQAIAWDHALNRNKITQTATVQSLRNDADAADIASAAVSDDGTTFIRGEWGN